MNKDIPDGRQISQRAEQYFKEGYNCCESMIQASVEIFNLPLPKDTYLMGKFFQKGVIGSGCLCGALAGGIMIMGYMQGNAKSGAVLADQFRTSFIEHFGSSCCRVIRKKHSIPDRIGNKKCREITGFAAGLLQELMPTSALSD